MDFILVTFGTSGDINPYAALGIALKKRGYQVKFLANGYFKDFIVKQGLEFIEVGKASEFREIIGHKNFFHPRKAFDFATNNIIIRYMPHFYRAILQEASSNSIIISQSFAPAPRIIHEKYSIPYISVNLQPFSFWSYNKPPVYSGFEFSEVIPIHLRRVILEMVNKFYIDRKFARGINPFLKEVAIPSHENYFSEWLYSPQKVIATFPEWFAQPATDWPKNTELTGFIALEEQQEIPYAMRDFLHQGNPPLVFTFGSSMHNTGSYFDAAIKATKALKKRAILITNNPSEIKTDPGNNFLISGYVPFQKLFPYIEAIVHHGGIGTIAHAIAAGKPQLLVPFAHDQPDNVSRTIKLGVGLNLHRKDFNSEALQHKLKQLLESEAIKSNCVEHSAKVNFRESMDNLINAIENFEKP